MSYTIFQTRAPMPSSNWTAENPRLAQFEEGQESDTGKVKRGPGLWNDLGYFDPGGSIGAPPLSTASSVTRLGAVVVSGAGTSAANGQYTNRGTNEGRPYYNLVGEPNGYDTASIYWNGSVWSITDDGSFTLYVSTGDSPTPQEATWEISGDSELPVPTVTFQPGLTGLSYGARVRQVDNGFTYYLTNPADPSSASSWQAEPKVYRALLTQTGTDAPVATVLENSLGGAVVWTREDVGQYTGASELLVINKTLIFLGSASEGVINGAFSSAVVATDAVTLA